MVQIWCPWCQSPYGATVGSLWSCPDCSDAFWDPYVIACELSEVETALQRLVALVPDGVAPSLKPEHSIWVNSFVGARTNERVDHLLIAFDEVYVPACEPKTERYREYISLGAVKLVDFSLEHSFGFIELKQDQYREVYGTGSTMLSPSEIWSNPNEFYEFNILVRHLAAMCASTHYRSLPPAAQLALAEEAISEHGLGDFCAKAQIYMNLYNYHRQIIISQLFGLTSTADAIAGDATKDWLSRAVREPDVRLARLVTVLFDEARLTVPRDLCAADVLDFRSAQACRRLRATLSQIIHGEDDEARQKELLLSDFRAELQRLDSWTRRFGQVEAVAISALAAAAGYGIGGLAGAIVGGVTAPASTDQLARITRAALGRSNWAYFFHDA